MKRKSFQERVNEVEAYILEQVKQGKNKITLAELMDAFNLSPNYLRDIIRILLIRHPNWRYESTTLILG